MTIGIRYIIHCYTIDQFSKIREVFSFLLFKIKIYQLRILHRNKLRFERVRVVIELK